MATLLRLDRPHAPDGRRPVVGVLVSSKCTQVAAALVSASGRGLDARVDLRPSPLSHVTSNPPRWALLL